MPLSDKQTKLLNSLMILPSGNVYRYNAHILKNKRLDDPALHFHAVNTLCQEDMSPHRTERPSLDILNAVKTVLVILEAYKIPFSLLVTKIDENF